MKYRSFFIISLMMSIMSSACSSLDMPEVEVQKSCQGQRLVETRANEEPLLSFDSEAAFLQEVKEIASLSSDEAKEEWISQNYPGFMSIQNLYWRAMDEMADIDDVNQERYSQFEEKYSGLYFPKYQEDAGYYIPMSNLDKAYFVNRNCEVSIAGEVKNLRDINEYEDLMRLGRAFYSNDGISTLSTPTPINYSGGNLDPVGEEYDSGWHTYKTDKYYKIKLKARRRWKGISQGAASGFESIFHLEFCFRKESWLGWSNFKSNTTMTFNANIPGYGTFSPSLEEKKGHSSHDWEFSYPINVKQDQQSRYITYYDTPCVATVRFKAIGYDVQYNWTMPAAQAKWPLYGNPTLIVPSY